MMKIAVTEAADLADRFDAEGRTAAEQGYVVDALDFAAIRDALEELVEAANDDDVELDDELAEAVLEYV